MRLAVLDDNLYARTYAGEVRPLSSTFNRFVEAVARTGRFATVRYLIPVRQLRIWEVEPALEPIDESLLTITPTTFFSGIGDYILRAGYVAGRNWPVINAALRDVDLLWLRLPASNAVLALAAARRQSVPHFGWLAGSAASVAAAQGRRFPLDLGARLIGHGYDAVTRLAAQTGPLIELDEELFASTLSEQEVAESRAAPAAPLAPARLIWVGRMAGEKGLDVLIDSFRRLIGGGREVMLTLVGDGPRRRDVEGALRGLPEHSVEDYGYVGDRAFLMKLLREAHLFVLPSEAEGVPKVLVDALGAGLPVVATDVGAAGHLLGGSRSGMIVPAGDAIAMAEAIGGLLDDSARRAEMRQAALAWAAEHTDAAQAGRLVGRLERLFPHLAWPS